MPEKDIRELTLRVETLEKEIEALRNAEDDIAQNNFINEFIIKRESNASAAGTPSYTFNIRWKNKIYKIFANDI